MRRGFQKRWVTVFTALLWFSAAGLQGLAPALSAFLVHHVATCSHHPEGCPAQCLCPKTGFAGDEESVSPDPSEIGALSLEARLHETAWVECSEARAASAPVFAVYLPEAVVQARWVEPSSPFPRAEPASARGVLPAPPAKIPIA
jgi:hypothetical protein